MPDGYRPRFGFHQGFDNYYGHILCWRDDVGNEVRCNARNYWVGRVRFTVWPSTEGRVQMVGYYRCRACNEWSDEPLCERPWCVGKRDEAVG